MAVFDSVLMRDLEDCWFPEFPNSGLAQLSPEDRANIENWINVELFDAAVQSPPHRQIFNVTYRVPSDWSGTPLFGLYAVAAGGTKNEQPSSMGILSAASAYIGPKDGIPFSRKSARTDIPRDHTCFSPDDQRRPLPIMDYGDRREMDRSAIGFWQSGNLWRFYQFPKRKIGFPPVGQGHPVGRTVGPAACRARARERCEKA